ncbi:MAG TPA: hypothetical protein VIK91_01320, partial [Nannocystis sp.]
MSPERRRRRRPVALSTRSRPLGGAAEIDIEADIEPPAAASVAPAVAVPSSPEERSGLRWIILAVVLLGGALAAFLVVGGRGSETAAGDSARDVKRAAARLDQIELMVLNGEFAKAREELAALRPQLDAGAAARADAIERRIAVLIALEVARKFEAAGDRGAAEKAYRDVLALDAGNAEARTALERLNPPPKAAEPPPEDEPRARPRPRHDKRGKPAGGKDPDPAPTKKDETDSIFLPTSK